MADFEHYAFDDSNNHATNVLDEFSGLLTHQVRGIRDENVNGMVNVTMNLCNDFNKASIVRAHCAFGGREMFIVGKRRFDRRGTVGTHHYIDIYHADSAFDVADHLRSHGYKLFAIDNTPEFQPQSLYHISFPECSAFFYGEEQAGLTREVVEQCDQTVYIPQSSPVPRSLNVAQAAAVVMSEYTRQNRLL